MTDETVNTGGNSPRRGQFVKGDPRINRRGRPRTFDALRKLAVKIAGEQADSEEVSRVVLMLREMSRSSNPSDRALFLAYAYGKPKEEVDLTGQVTTKVQIEYVDSQNNPAETPPGATPGQADPEKV